jgi:trans-2-enoyl-CoA reductase
MRVDKEGLKSTQVATVSVNPVTAWRMLRDFVELREGNWWIQNGANSGVGRAAIQLGRLWGLRCIAVVRGRAGEEGERLKRELERLGATRVVTDEEVGEKGFKDKVMGWTNGGREKVMLGLNCVGGDAAMAMAKVLSDGAHMVTYGAMSKSPMRIGASLLIFKDLRFSGFWVSRWADANPEQKMKTVEEILQLIREGNFKDVPMVEVPWNWDTKKEELVQAVEGTLGGYRKGKGIFMFGDT